MLVSGGLWLSARKVSDGILASTGTHFIALQPESPGNCGNGDAGCCFSGMRDEGLWFNGVPTRLLPPDFIRKVAALHTVRDASACLLFRIRSSTQRASCLVAGVDAAHPTAVKSTSCAASDLISGRFFNPSEQDGALLEQAYASSQRLAPGGKVGIGEREFSIVGIVNTGVRPAKADVYITLQDAREIVCSKLESPPVDPYNLVLVEARDSNTQDQAISEVKALLKDSSISSYNCYKPAAQVMGINQKAGKLLLGAIGLSTLLLALKSQWAGMIERRRDIAILKTIGWTPRVIIALLVLESLLQALAGGILGCAAGQVLLLAGSVYGLGVSLPWSSVSPVAWAAACGLVLLGGLIAGVIPALYAAREWPATGMRTA